MRYLKLPIDLIDEGERFRKDVGDINSLMESIKEKGVIQPITVAPNKNAEGRYVLIAGGRRLAACKKLNEQTIPAIERKLEGELDLREMELIENTCRQGMTWQEQFPLIQAVYDMQVTKYGEKGAQKRSADLLGFAPSYISKVLTTNRMVDDLPELKQIEDHTEARNAYTRLISQQLTKNKISEAREAFVEKAPDLDKMSEAEAKDYRKTIMLDRAEKAYITGDCIEAIKKHRAESVSFAEVDPPYGIDLDVTRDARGNNTPGLQDYNEVPMAEYDEFLLATASAVYRALKQNTYCVWWYGPTHEGLVKKNLKAAGFTIDDVPAIWYKEHSTGGSMNPDIKLIGQYEPFIVCRKGSPRLAKFPRTNVFAHQGVPHQKRIHTTERPISLMLDILQTFVTPEKNTHILIPFMGSVVTLLAAYQHGVNGHGYDLSGNMKAKFLTRLDEMLESGEINV